MSSKLIAKIKKACEDCIEDANKAIEEVTDGSEDIYEGRMEFAEQILSLVSDNEKEVTDEQIYLQSIGDI